MKFLEATTAPSEAVAAILGLPWDGSVSYRPGAAEAPIAIRAASDSIESWSPVTRRDLEDVALADLGDLELSGNPKDVMEQIAGAAERAVADGLFLVSLGGDHSVSIGTTAGVRRVHPELTHIVFDAHFDLRREYGGSEYNHACGTRHMAQRGPTGVLGVRSGSREEYEEAPKLLTFHSDGIELNSEAREEFAGNPVFLSLDLDVLDPSSFPGTGTPEPGGPTYKELRSALLALSDLNIVAIDLVEAAPALDPSGVTSVVAAELCRDLLLGLGPR